MKKFLSLLLTLSLVLCAVSCSATQNNTPTEATKKASTTTAQATANPSPSEPQEPTGPEDSELQAPSFYVGYAKADITPDFSVPIGANMTVGASDKIYATIIAVSDGENKALLITADLKHSKDTILRRTKLIAEIYGVPSENVILNTTHNHSIFDYSLNDYPIVKWRNLYYDAIEEGIASALADLRPAAAEIGEAKTTGFAFVRRYYMEDGSFKSIHHSNPSQAYKEHETEADDVMQVIRFKREDAKDVVMVNWQAHPAQAIELFPEVITSDFVNFFREGAEEQFDINFAYYQGACGNINNLTYIKYEKKFENYIELGRALPDVLGEALENMTPVSLGKIQVESAFYDATVNHEDDHLYEKALKVVNEADEGAKYELAKKLGFHSKYEAIAIVRKYGLGDTEALPLTAISFGDLAFATTPYEMFDTNGMQVKDGSPFKMTFMCTCTNGHFGYIPSNLGYENGGYEAYSSRFVCGTGELVADKLVEMLIKQYNNK